MDTAPKGLAKLIRGSEWPYTACGISLSLGFAALRVPVDCACLRRHMTGISSGSSYSAILLNSDGINRRFPGVQIEHDPIIL